MKEKTGLALVLLAVLLGSADSGQWSIFILTKVVSVLLILLAVLLLRQEVEDKGLKADRKSGLLVLLCAVSLLAILACGPAFAPAERQDSGVKVKAERLLPAQPSSEVDELRAAYLEWMSSVSRQPWFILERIYDAASRQRNRALVLAVAYQESWPRFNPHSYSRTGDICLMQVNPRMWLAELRRKGIVKRKRDLWNIDRCVEAGSYILNLCLSRNHGNLVRALRCYSGRGTDYALRVLRVYAHLLNLEAEVEEEGLKICFYINSKEKLLGGAR